MPTCVGMALYHGNLKCNGSQDRIKNVSTSCVVLYHSHNSCRADGRGREKCINYVSVMCVNMTSYQLWYRDYLGAVLVFLRGKKGGFHCLRDSQHALLWTILHRCVCSLQHRLPQPRRRIQPCPWWAPLFLLLFRLLLFLLNDKNHYYLSNNTINIIVLFI